MGSTNFYSYKVNPLPELNEVGMAIWVTKILMIGLIRTIPVKTISQGTYKLYRQVL